MRRHLVVLTVWLSAVFSGTDAVPVHLIWIGGIMSQTQRLCIASVARHQQDVTLLCSDPRECLGIDERVRVKRLEATLHCTVETVTLTGVRPL